MIYRIKTPYDSFMCKRVDTALALLRVKTYECIKAHGGLDTEWGWKTMKQVECADMRKGGAVSSPYFTIFYSSGNQGD